VWAKQGSELDYASLTAEASEVEPFRSLINPNAARFAKSGDMPAHIEAYCRETRQPAPQSRGQFARCILESLALSYRAALDEIEEITGRSIARLHIVGGGSQSALLNQFAADATQREVIAGPVEATAAGNVLIQAIALGHVESLEALRKIVSDSFPLSTFKSRDSASWQDAYRRFTQLTLATQS
jgi:rhamnulokinase